MTTKAEREMTHEFRPVSALQSHLCAECAMPKSSHELFGLPPTQTAEGEAEKVARDLVAKSLTLTNLASIGSHSLKQLVDSVAAALTTAKQEQRERIEQLETQLADCRQRERDNRPRSGCEEDDIPWGSSRQD